MTMLIPTPDDVRRQRKLRATALRRRDHFHDRIAAATTPRQQLNEAFDYLRATLSGMPEQTVEQTTLVLLDMGDKIGGLA